MPDNFALVLEKLDQAVAILDEQGVDAWMTFVRETAISPDPSLDLILGMDVVWQSAFIITRDNQRIALIGRHDEDNVKACGGYTRIIPYVEGIRTDLINILMELDPAKIALNYSENDVAADGIGYGLMMLLQRYLGDTDFADRCMSAEQIIGALRGRKSTSEVERIKGAITTTQHIFRQMEEIIQPGKSELQIANEALAMVDELGVETSWERQECPAVTVGADSPVGHGGPQPDIYVKKGSLIHIDFGVRQDSYCSDLQRVWYVRQGGETIPDEVRRAFDAARKALLAGFHAIKPGIEGWQVDEVARRTLIEAGYPEYQHAFGHQVGRAVHDGSTALAPRWERYGNTPHSLIEAGNVFAIELDIQVPGHGLIGLEENILVTSDGAEWLSDPQTEVWAIG